MPSRNGEVEVVRPTPTFKTVKAAIYLHNGNLNAVARYFGKTYRWAYDYVRANEGLAPHLAMASEQMLDKAEESICAQVIAGNVTATMFYLKTKGKKRGYSEQEEKAPEKQMTDEEKLVLYREFVARITAQQPAGLIGGPTADAHPGTDQGTLPAGPGTVGEVHPETDLGPVQSPADDGTGQPG